MIRKSEVSYLTTSRIRNNNNNYNDDDNDNDNNNNKPFKAEW